MGEVYMGLDELEIDSLEAGDKLDGLIAEHVLGWKELRWDAGGYKRLVSHNWNEPTSTMWPQGWYGIGPNHERYLTHKFGTDWNAMELIVDQFRFGKHKQVNGAFPCACVVEMIVSDWDFGGGDCECTIYSPALAKVTAVAMSMPLAVARCALKVALVEPANTTSNPEI
jgi:hypothetical protein